MPESQARCECLWMKMVGKPYSGKPNVRIDEGALEIERIATTPALYSTEVEIRARNWIPACAGMRGNDKKRQL
jgi:hypothetical protein